MLEWLLGLGAVGWFLYAVNREKKRPKRRQIHCHIEFVDEGDYLDLMVHNAYGVEITASFKWPTGSRTVCVTSGGIPSRSATDSS